MVIKNNNVGIGIADPKTKLHVDGVVTASDFVDSDGILTANEKLCIGETCVDEEQLQYMLNPKVDAPVAAPVAAPANVDLGNVHIGQVGHGVAWQGIANKNNVNKTDYALIQHNNGRTILNSKVGQPLKLKQGNIDKMNIDPDGNVEIKKNATVDSLHLGQVGHGVGWQGIANKKNVNKTNYALIQHNNGSTILNSKAGQNLHFRQGNVDKMKIDKNGNTTIDGVHIGDVGHGGAWQGIANKNNVNKTNYALIQHNNGTTILNSKAGQTLNFNQGNVNRMKIDSNGNVEIRGKLCIDDKCITKDDIVKLINMTKENKLFSTNDGIGDFKFDAINAQYIRIYPQSWNKHISLRFDVYVNNNIQSNNENTRTYSSIWNNDAIGTGHARSMLNSVQGWSAGKNSIGEWTQINLGSNKSVNGIKILKRTSYTQYIKTFYIKYSTDNVVWNYLKVN